MFLGFFLVLYHLFKVGAIVGDNIPVDAMFAPPIIVHNPSKTDDLRILEVFTTESFLHLSFPEWGEDGAQAGRPVG